MGDTIKRIRAREVEKRSGAAAAELFKMVDYLFVNLEFSDYGELTQRLAFVFYSIFELLYGHVKNLLKQFLWLRMTLGDGMK